jgi:NADH dehydrogenase
MNQHRIVIVGGGAGGLPLAARLGDRYGRNGQVLVTLVDRHSTHVWKPLLHEVAAGRMDADLHDVDYPAIAHWHGFRFMQGALVGLERARREILLDAVQSDGEETLPRRVLGYDTLIICVGSVSNDFAVPGVAEHAIALDEAADAERFHRRLLASCVRADARAASGQHAVVDIVIVGAGATGVELAAELRQTTRVHAGYGLEHLHPGRDIRIALVEAGPRILGPLPATLASAALELLQRLDIDVHAGERVTAIGADGVRTTSRLFAADLVVWAAGIKAPEILRSLDGLEVNRANQIIVKSTLQTTQDPDIFAFGEVDAGAARGPAVARVPFSRLRLARVTRPTVGRWHADGSPHWRQHAGTGPFCPGDVCLAVQAAPDLDSRCCPRGARHAGADAAQKAGTSREAALKAVGEEREVRSRGRFSSRSLTPHGTLEEPGLAAVNWSRALQARSTFRLQR